MIVPMKRLTLLCLQRDQDTSLDRLRDLGAIHLTPAAPPDSDDWNAARLALEAAQAAAEVLAGQAAPVDGGAAGLAVDAVVSETLLLIRQRKDLQAALDPLQRERAAIEPFGQFEPESVQRLAATGVFVRLYVLGRKPVDVPAGASLKVLREDASGRYAALVSRSESASLAGRELPLPARSLAACDRDLAAQGESLGAIDRRLGELAARLADVRTRAKVLTDTVTFLEARDGMGQAGLIAYLQGYCPAERADDLRKEAAAHGWGLLLADPEPGAPVPTLIRNPAWIEPVKAIFKIIGIVPGYQEVDISGVFLLFYSLFFAMLVGDAGYGVLFLLLTLGLRTFARKVPPELPRLLGVLSVCTIVWGVLTGSYFGIRFESLPAPLQGVRIAWLTDEVNLMSLCFLIGSIHLSIAHAWNAVRSGKSLQALAQLGWIAITWTMYFMAQNMILGRVLPGFVLPLFLVGLAAVLLFMTPFKAMKTEWPNHVMLPLSVIGNFGDVVSYVRLFAVGSAGAAISMAFNDMAVGGGIHSIGAGLAAALILFLAHTLNILLSALGVIVHGVRLNTLEFSGHLGMQWTGIPFKPFRRVRDEA
jgi:V/A-type H+-transporting ATPase subunit I